MFKEISRLSDSDIFPVLADSYSYVISNFSKHNDRIMFVSNDDNKLELIAKQLQFFAPEKKVVIFPSWDCMPYDRVSPNTSNLNQRIKALNELLLFDNVILLISLGALIQFLPPKQLFKDFSREVVVNQSIKREEFLQFLTQLSFRRVDVASEPGDFAVRGDIIDIVADIDKGWRLDFFGDKLEKIREFDPVTQISNKIIDKITILPSSEIILTSDTIHNFCKNFCKYFGAQAIDHPIYQALESGRKYQGMEHYLPIFYENVSTIFDYFSPNLIIFNNGFHGGLIKKIDEIESHFQKRKEFLVNHFQDEIIYYPVLKNLFWFNKNSLQEKLHPYKKVFCHNFNVDISTALDLSIKQIDNFDSLSRSKSLSAFDLLREFRDKNKKKIIIACNSEGSSLRVKNILDNYNIHWYWLVNFTEYKNISNKSVGIAILPMEHGYFVEDFAIITEQDLFGEKIIRKKTNKDLEQLLDEINNLQIGEYIVHQQHGIGLFSGLETLTVNNIDHDCLKIIYDDNDILYIPVENLDLLTRYGSSEDHVRLDKLGGVSWVTRKAKLKEKLKEIAAELVKTAAIRANREGEHLVPVHGAYEEFSARFSYIETEDQANSIKDVENDLSSGVPMDRLICGDVGFGKTEVAMRAAFIATHPEKNIKQQVAIIVPTTLLARQHYHGFIKRFAGFPVQIKQLSRLVSAKETKLIKEGIKDGNVDIIIGTHALLAKDIEFKNLGLLIVDEEQRFGVIQKEKLKKMQEHIHILTLSATPIPRTLQMSLTGVRDLSIIATPPVDRQAVKTYIMNYDSIVIREAILREFYRGGQIFYVCPRISDISEILPKLNELVPEVKVVVAHGQMSPSTLEEIMNDFYNKKFDILLSTTIVESGIDIPQANTIFIHRADKFGLSSLYQLRGRVGRSNIKAFAYLLLPNKTLSKTATSRLEVMHTLDSLGAGFTVASHDMDIRGFGNLVGDEQSGHIREVGLELYQQMLQEAILSLKSRDNQIEEINEEYSPQINLGVPVLLPEEYIEDLNLRLSLYRKLANFKTTEEIDHFAVEMIDRFGTYPTEVEYLLNVIKLKIKAKKINIDKIDAGPKAITLGFRDNKFSQPEKLMEFINHNQLFVKLRSDQKLLINKSFVDSNQKIKFIEELLHKLDF